MRILIIQHSAADSLASAKSVIDALGHEIVAVRVDRQQPIPVSVECDAMIMLGGPFPLTAPHRPAWIAEEQDLIRKYAESDRRILGICLGAQILASALGATVQRNQQPELGWHEIRRTSRASSLANHGLPDQMTVFHWHQDTFDIPSGADRLYESSGCRNQAFSIDDRIFGLQFHLEADARTIRTFLAISTHRKLLGNGVQNKAEIMAEIPQYLPEQINHLRAFLSLLLPQQEANPKG